MRAKFPIKIILIRRKDIKIFKVLIQSFNKYIFLLDKYIYLFA